MRFLLARYEHKSIKEEHSLSFSKVAAVKGILRIIPIICNRFHHTDAAMLAEFENILTEVWIYICLLSFHKEDFRKMILTCKVAQNWPKLSPWILFNFETSNLFEMTKANRASNRI